MEAMTIDVNFIANFSTNDTISSNNFRVCVNAYPIVTTALYNYCNAGIAQNPNQNRNWYCPDLSSGTLSNWNECANHGVLNYGVYATGCRKDSPTLESVLNQLVTVLKTSSYRYQTFLLYLNDYTAGYQTDSKFTNYQIREALTSVIESTIGSYVFTPDKFKDYRVVSNWPTPDEMTAAGTPILLFTTNQFNSENTKMFNTNLYFTVQTNVQTPSTCPTRSTAFYYTQGNSVTYQYTNAQGVSCSLFSKQGAKVASLEVSHITKYKSCDMSQFFDQLDPIDLTSTLWAFPTTGLSTSTPSTGTYCFGLSQATGRLDVVNCDISLPFLCRNISNPYAWTVSETTNGGKYPVSCPTGYMLALPSRPSEMIEAVSDVTNYYATQTSKRQQSWTVWVNLRLKDGCYVSDSKTQCLPLAVVDDDLTDGEIAAVVILSVFGFLLLLLLLFFLSGRRSSQKFVGSGPSAQVDNPDA